MMCQLRTNDIQCNVVKRERNCLLEELFKIIRWLKYVLPDTKGHSA